MTLVFHIMSCAALASCALASGWAGPPANIALSQDGRNVLDTPEVAQARAAHLAALQHAAQSNPNPHDDGSYDPRWDNEEYWQQAEQPKWNAPSPAWNPAAQYAGPAAQYPGPAWSAPAAPAPVAETPEVAQARAAHLAALSAAKGAPQWNSPNPQWHAPAPKWNAPQWNGAPSWQSAPAHQPAEIRLAHDGSGILETPEVAAARAAHLAAHAQAAHSTPPHPQQHW